MDKINVINATKARNNFFSLIQESYLEKKLFLVEKADIPVVYIIPFSEKFPIDSYSQIKMKEDLETIKEIEKLRKSMPKTSDSVTLLRELRQHGS